MQRNGHSPAAATRVVSHADAWEEGFLPRIRAARLAQRLKGVSQGRAWCFISGSICRSTVGWIQLAGVGEPRQDQGGVFRGRH